MADDAVKAARHDLIEDINAIASNEAISGSGVIESIDALIAAVRAENADAWVKAMANEVEVLRSEVMRLTAEIQQHLDQTFDRADKQR